MNRQEIEDIVLDTVATILKRPLDAGLNSTRSSIVEWDSLKHVEIMFALEDELGTEFSEEELAQLDSVMKIVDVVAARQAA
ncbi:acyl carrier protein [Undibacterium terreum]|uniref:Carrier domain-containing protein n=1 Tax=Undibacterium terreum TaxID=1224302 RepID=A0A916V1I0_9BURK|nr:acyl carrier protein [Undibacterium terreum]GGD00291.1 hypothetical protein GCM10011396_54790 [Undibacterium terreum]